VEWHDTQRFPLTRTSVLRNAPEESGVYGLCSPGKWIYIGHSFNIRKALLEYLSGQRPYVLQWQPKYFLFELMPYKKRVSRHKSLVAQYQPVCNRKTQNTRWLAVNTHQEFS
jgi:hypothetical protein